MPAHKKFGKANNEKITTIASGIIGSGHTESVFKKKEIELKKREDKEKKRLHEEYIKEQLQKEQEKEDLSHTLDKLTADETSITEQFEMMRNLVNNKKKKLYDSDSDNDDENKEEEKKDEKKLVKDKDHTLSIAERILSKSLEASSDDHQSNDKQQIKNNKNKFIALRCEKQRSHLGLNMNYIIIVNDKEEVVFEQFIGTNKDLNEVSFGSCCKKVCKILKEYKIIIGYNIYNDLQKITDTAKERDLLNNLINEKRIRDLAIINPQIEAPLIKEENEEYPDIKVILSKLLNIKEALHWNAMEVAKGMVQLYKIYGKVYNQYCLEDENAIVKLARSTSGINHKKGTQTDRIKYAESFMQNTNASIDNLIQIMKNK
ncbi:hypothetical protein ABK040_007709 [Willaertia magna]